MTVGFASRGFQKKRGDSANHDNELLSSRRRGEFERVYQVGPSTMAMWYQFPKDDGQVSAEARKRSLIEMPVFL